MKNIDFIYKPTPKIKLSGKEVIKIINDKPHLLLRLELSGDYFPHLDRPPFVRIMYSRKNNFELCWFANVSDDNRSIYAYFPIDCKMASRIEYGYGNEVIGKVTEKIAEDRFEKLNNKKLEKSTVSVTQRYLSRMMKKGRR